eukprot:jgi/Botrbrau1/2583/Bobra.145_1s0011.1
MWDQCGIEFGIDVGLCDQSVRFWDRNFRSHIDPTSMWDFGGIDVGSIWE